jgi:hypothetical protein
MLIDKDINDLKCKSCKYVWLGLNVCRHPKAIYKGFEKDSFVYRKCFIVNRDNNCEDYEEK